MAFTGFWWKIQHISQRSLTWQYSNFKVCLLAQEAEISTKLFSPPVIFSLDSLDFPIHGQHMCSSGVKQEFGENLHHILQLPSSLSLFPVFLPSISSYSGYFKLFLFLWRLRQTGLQIPDSVLAIHETWFEKWSWG